MLSLLAINLEGSKENSNFRERFGNQRHLLQFLKKKTII
jgi:hypothetical protein